MYQPVSLFIAVRYIHGRTSDHFGRFISSLSTIGIILGTLSLIIVVSVMNGFERELENNILNLIPQALITSEKGSINPKQFHMQQLKLNGITHIAPLTTSNVLLQSVSNISMGVMLGINPEEYDTLRPFLIDTNIRVLQPDQYNIIISKQLSTQLNIKYGDKLRLIVPSISQFTPIGRMPSQRLFTVAGIYETGTEVDGYQILINIQDAGKIMHLPIGNITGWRLWVKKPLKIDHLSQEIIPNGMIWKDWRESKGELFRAMIMEKNMMILLLSLIISVASFNITASLNLLIMDKKAEIAILQTQGFTYRQIITVFMLQGISTGIIGALLGTLFGLLLTNQLNNFTPVINLLFNRTKFPVDIKIGQVFTISLTSIVISILSTLYPAWKASSNKPAETLRYE
ncbi:lipoprotein-releasing ABC transporter permease subunit LolC [Pantoea sp. Aalb]|uniref:lipoprotein-releasing ABC transporter permease subunit LolC n=1 Tax=Pantoea sp. Aalb TaxID=2576762 RepID=UPI00132505BF|nr:lipoprotein-releasing ABC transporter permease subunit LolC [Pantoea sp. Aalb]MXP67454.1 lipoprotein-releasing ABC transporter permease subunit LolC [Pantoea sp. Aalb]